MALYCTKQDLINRYGSNELIQLTDRFDQGVIDDTVLDHAREAASAKIDGYLLSGGYTLPLQGTYHDLRSACESLTRRELYVDMPGDDTLPAARDAKAALQWLEKVADGSIRLGTGEDGDESEGGATVAVKTRAQVFTNDLMSKY